MSKVFNGLMVALTLCTFFFIGGCKSDGAFSDVADSDVRLERISIRAFPVTTSGSSVLTLAIGKQQPFEATGYYSDGTFRALTDLAVDEWQTSNSEVAFFAGPGLLSAKTVGRVIVQVNKAGLQSNQVELTVSDAQVVRLEVIPSKVTVPKGYMRELKVKAIYTDGTSTDESGFVGWTESDPQTARMTRQGFVLGMSPGVSSVRPRLDGVEGNEVEVTVTDAAVEMTGIYISNPRILPNQYFIRPGEQWQLSVILTHSDGSELDITHRIIWESQDPDSLHVSPTGILTGTDNISIVDISAYDPQSGLKSDVIFPEMLDHGAYNGTLDIVYVGSKRFSSPFSPRWRFSEAMANIPALTSNGEYSYKVAKDICDSLSEVRLDGVADWHVPQVEEVQALYDFFEPGYLVNTRFWGDWAGFGWVWTATSDISNINSQLTLNLMNGTQLSVPVASRTGVICVSDSLSF
ncbi:Lcl C-terminal domain-containing protein [Vibrio cholerae]|uniref:hypothetical protein n=1 Tax=Vibrio cholerae TaxID=666 RepID=UPI002DB969E7|nr:hypothetical protein [Vibrio cholerae]